MKFFGRLLGSTKYPASGHSSYSYALFEKEREKERERLNIFVF
jgi:hypothetical protein